MALVTWVCGCVQTANLFFHHMSSFSSVVLYRPETSFVLDLQSYNGNTEAILALYKTWLGEKLGEKLLAFLSVLLCI